MKKRITSLLLALLLVFCTLPLSLTAFAEEETVMVIFSRNFPGASVSAPVYVPKGSTVEPFEIAREGYIFLGWYTDAEGTQAFDFSEPIYELTWLYAKWKEAGSTFLDYNEATGVFEESPIPRQAQRLSAAGTLGADGTESWYYVEAGDTLSLSGNLTILGDVHLILKEDSELQLNGRVAVEKNDRSFSVYAQSSSPDTMGSLTAVSASTDSAGIGSGNETECGTININGGRITATGKTHAAGIGGGDINRGGSVNIRGGIVEAHGGSTAAGIGVGEDSSRAFTVRIDGGKVTAYSGDEGAAIGGANKSKNTSVIINGGEVYAIATGKYGAGIGTGDDSTATVTINGGYVEAIGVYAGSGIGSGDSNDRTSDCTVEITGGEIHAAGGEKAPGIGSGYDGSRATVTISGGIIEANGGQNNAPGIGSAYKADQSKSSCTLTVTGAERLMALGNGTAPALGANGGNCTLSLPCIPSCGYTVRVGSALDTVWEANDYSGEKYVRIARAEKPRHLVRETFSVTLSNGESIRITECLCGQFYAGESCGDELIGDAGELLAFLTEAGAENLYLLPIPEKDTFTVRSAPAGILSVPETATSLGTAGEVSWYKMSGTMQLTKLNIIGEVHLILCDGADITASGGLLTTGTGNDLVVYSQSFGENMGKLSAYGGDFDPALGSGGTSGQTASRNSGGNLTINGGKIYAKGGYGAPGIGGGSFSRGTLVTINGGDITADSGNMGAGIGAGMGAESDVTIRGGTVTADSITHAAAIGAGAGNMDIRTVLTCNTVSHVSITGGKITASCGALSAAIGSGSNDASDYNRSVSTVSITGGDILAYAKNPLDISCAIGQTNGECTPEAILPCDFCIHVDGNELDLADAYRGEKRVHLVYEPGHKLKEFHAAADPVFDGAGALLAYGHRAYYESVCGKFFDDPELTHLIGGEEELAVWLTSEGRVRHLVPGPSYLDYDAESASMTEKHIPNDKCRSVPVDAAVLGDGAESWYYFAESAEFHESVAVSGDVHLVLADGITLQFDKSILISGMGNQLTVYAQSSSPDTMGTIIACGTPERVAIGAPAETSGGKLTVNGGNIHADFAIGASKLAAGFEVCINNGNIDSVASDEQAAIGAGPHAECTVEINGGVIVAKQTENRGDVCGPAIGGGALSTVTVRISGGKITATSVSNRPAAIGCGYLASADITITGGEILAKGGQNVIGKGTRGESANVHIRYCNFDVFTGSDPEVPASVLGNASQVHLVELEIPRHGDTDRDLRCDHCGCFFSASADTDADGCLGIADLTLLAKYLAGWDVILLEGDANGSGSVDIADLTLVAKYLAGWQVESGFAYPKS